jgi:transcriptional regulator with XRE-family HTH domain
MKNHRTLVHFGRNVRRFRLEADLAQDDVARQCAKFSDQIPQIEDGSVNPTLSMIVALAQALDVEPSTLIRGVP